MLRDAGRRLASVALVVLGFASAALAQDAGKEKSGEVRINGFGDWRYAATDGDNLVLSGEPDGSFKFARFGIVISERR